MPNLLPDSVFDTPTQTTQAAQPAMLPDSAFGIASPQDDYSQIQSGILGGLAQSVENLPRDIVAGAAYGGQGLHNAPYNLVNAVSPKAAAALPQFLQPTNINASQVLGVTNPSLFDKLVQGSAQYAPYALGGEAAGASSLLGRLGAQGAAGGAFGLTQSNTPIKSVAMDALGNTVLGGVGEAAGAIPGGIKNYLSRFAVKGINNQLADNLNGLKNVSNAQAFQLAKNNLENNWLPQESAAWNELQNQAAVADANPEVNFDNTGYQNSLQNKLNELQQQSNAQSGYARANKDAISLLNGYMNDQHGTFTDAIAHNKALNQDFQNEITPGKSLPFNIVNFAKGNIKNAIDDNLQQNGLQDTLGQAWNNANAITQQKNQIFNQLATTKGNPTYSSFSQLLKNANTNQYVDPTPFVRDYVPTSRGEGIQKMQQFSQMIGDDDAAKNILKMNYFDNAFSGTGNKLEPQKFLDRYNNLSTDQQNYLFNPNENNLIQSMNKIRDNYPDAMKKPGMASGVMHATIPALIGAVGAHATGSGEFLGALAGLGAAKMGQRGMDYLLGRPSATNYFVNYLTKAAPSNPNSIGRLVARQALPVTLTPQINQLGGSQ